MRIIKAVSNFVKSFTLKQPWQNGGGLFGDDSANGTVKDSVWAIGGVEGNAQSLASVPIRFIDSSRGNVLDESKMNSEQKAWAQVLYFPDPNISSEQIWAITSMVYEIDGVAFWLLLDDNYNPISNPLEIPAVIQVFGTDNVFPVYQTGSLRIVDHWTFRANGFQINLQQFQIVRFWRPNPFSYLNGLKLTDKIGSTLALDRDVKKVNKGFFRRGGRPSGILEATKKWDSEELKQWGRDFKNKYTGAENAGGIPITPDGIKFNVSESTKDMDFEKLNNVNRSEIFGGTRYPKFKMGVTDNINRATADILNSSHWLEVIKPTALTFAGIINTRLLSGTGMEMQFDFSVIPVLQLEALEVEERKLKVAARYWRLGYSPNDIAKKLDLGMPFINEKWGSAPHDPLELPSNAQPSGGEGEASTKAIGIKSPFEDMRVFLERSLARSVDEKSDLDLARDGDEDAAERYIRTIEENTVDIYAPVLEKIMTKYFKDLRASQMEKLRLFFAGESYIGRAAGDERELTEDVVDGVLFSMAAWNVRLITDTSGIHLSTYKAAIEGVKDELGGFSLFVPSDQAAANAVATITSKITRVNDTVRAALKKTMMEQIEKGGSQADIIAELNKDFDAADNRVTTIARNETGNAVGKARWDAMSVELETKAWISAKDDGVRDSHKLYAKMKSVPIDYSYADGLKHPHDMNASAKETINCRCVLVKGK